MLWPEKHSEDSLRSLQADFKREGLLDVYGQEYLNDPIDESVAYFKRSWFKEAGKEKRNMDYYVGMAYYARKRQPEAAAAFRQLLTDYPTSQYAPRALARMGRAYQEMDQWARAREAYDIYIKYFPDGEKRRIIDKRLERIRLKGAGEESAELREVYESLAW